MNASHRAAKMEKQIVHDSPESLEKLAANRSIYGLLISNT